MAACCVPARKNAVNSRSFLLLFHSGAKMAPLKQELCMSATTARRRPIDPQRSRISARVPTTVQIRLEEAAELVGATVSQFVLQAALKEADRVIEYERVIAPSARDAKMVLSL